MKTLIFPLAVVFAGCSTVVPVKQEFPAVPTLLLERCPELQVVDDGKNSLRDMLKTVIQNYSLYYQCAEKNDAWREWYQQQKRIHNNVK
jgi:hypothetical protein